MNVAILIPVLARPHRARPALESALAATPGARVLFVCDDGDDAEQAAVREAGGDMIVSNGTYGEKIRAGIRSTVEPLVFAGADDLDWHLGWLAAALTHMRGGVECVGVNDLIQRSREHSTHFLMTRAYAERPCMDGEPGPFSAAYAHWMMDDELIATARARGAYAYAPDSIVEHLHPYARKASWDSTYQRGAARRRRDRLVFESRRRLWETVSA